MLNLLAALTIGITFVLAVAFAPWPVGLAVLCWGAYQTGAAMAEVLTDDDDDDDR